MSAVEQPNRASAPGEKATLVRNPILEFASLVAIAVILTVDLAAHAVGVSALHVPIEITATAFAVASASAISWRWLKRRRALEREVRRLAERLRDARGAGR